MRLRCPGCGKRLREWSHGGAGRWVGAPDGSLLGVCTRDNCRVDTVTVTIRGS